MLIRRLMATDFPRVFPETELEEVARLLFRQGEAILVLGIRGELLGLITEGDLLRRAADPHRPEETGLWRYSFAPAGGDPPGGRTAGEIMTASPRVAGPDQEVRAVLGRMVTEGLKFLPVVDGLRAVGLVSRRDLLRLYLSQPRAFGPADGRKAVRRERI